MASWDPCGAFLGRPRFLPIDDAFDPVFPPLVLRSFIATLVVVFVILLFGPPLLGPVSLSSCSIGPLPPELPPLKSIDSYGVPHELVEETSRWLSGIFTLKYAGTGWYLPLCLADWLTCSTSTFLISQSWLHVVYTPL
ncbi:hypothetical protein N7495_007139 [Penicillium taxi]|uniref:uncharacterized protein n=1 Tax=Penicillium taxi TaxID=168475 RepID=UPI0025452C33|nr:uncharacterized protein N7495_007139 [Penicillium taxi]KAJ5895448.1 hypothetical protein N7495_007139 [Penicillium taxi]